MALQDGQGAGADEEAAMNAMYAEAVEPIKAPVKGAGKAEKSNKEKGKKKKKKKKASRGPLLI